MFNISIYLATNTSLEFLQRAQLLCLFRHFHKTAKSNY